MAVLAERHLAMNSLGRMRISQAQLIYNFDRNMKSSLLSVPELIKSAMGENGAESILLTNVKTCRKKYQDIHSLGETRTAHKDFKRVNFKDKKGFLWVVRED